MSRHGGTRVSGEIAGFVLHGAKYELKYLLMLYRPLRATPGSSQVSEGPRAPCSSHLLCLALSALPATPAVSSLWKGHARPCLLGPAAKALFPGRDA
jgi:hypothetical protein